MLLKFAGIKTQYALGLRWAVDDRSGIEAIQFNTDLHYGIMLEISEKISRKLRLVALCDASHNKAVCLSGLLAARFQNLILVHRMTDSLYWVCIVKNGSVWSGMDVPKATAGDFIGNISMINEVIDVAKAEFEMSGIDLQDILLSSDTASEDFPDYKAVDFFSFVTKLKKEKKFVIRYLQPSKIFMRKLLILIMLIIAAIGAAYYIQQQRLLTRILYQQQIEQERQRQLVIQQKIDYFDRLRQKLKTQVGYAVVKNVLTLLKSLPLQSQGWNLTKVVYLASEPKSLSLDLVRTQYGTLDSFLYAYSKTAINGSLESNSNTGSKMFTVSTMIPEEGPGKISNETLTQDIPKESYRLISYMQLNQELFKFQMKSKSRSQYSVSSTTFEIKGDKLWQLMQFETMLTSFQTLVINRITFSVNNSDYDMSWTIEGEIYA